MAIRITAALCAAALAGCSGNMFVEEPVTADGQQEPGGIQQSDLADYEPSSKAYFDNLVGDTVYFEVDQSGITERSADVLRGQAQWLNQNPDFAIRIEGHADERGTREYNLALGARRADAVKAFLVSLGVADFRVNTVTYGKERPVAVCSEESCWSKNRRSVTSVARETGG